MPRLLSVNVGLPRDVTWNGKTVRTSVWKYPVDGRRMVRKLDIDGDAQADLAGSRRPSAIELQTRDINERESVKLNARTFLMEHRAKERNS